MKLQLDRLEVSLRTGLYQRAEVAAPYVAHLQRVSQERSYDAAEASLHLAFDEHLLETTQQVVASKVTSSLRYIFVVGIGGSNLGTKAIYDALYAYEDLVTHDRPQMIFVDTINDTVLCSLIEQLLPTIDDPEEYLLLSISKSGGTTETLANTEILSTALETHVGNVAARTVVITDEDSAYWQAAEVAGIATLAIPEKVGGRFSVLSAVGLVPLLALGLDVTALRQGARDILPYCLNDDVHHNPAWQSAALLAEALAQGKTINDTFVFNSELESLGKWYRQLLGESVGKEHDVSGAQVHIGITPTVSVGSTDLHSVGQLYLGGPKDKLTTFVYTAADQQGLPVPPERMFSQTVPMIEGKTTTAITTAILEGVKVAYTNNDLPFMEVVLDEISPYELGAFMQFKMIEMMILGNLLQVNPFDQPNVESYKVETKRFLEK